MCFVIDDSFKTRQLARDASKKPLIAKHDIIVFKILEIDNSICRDYNLYYSPHQGMRYDKGTIYHNNFSFSIVKNHLCLWNIRVYRGLHSYISQYHAKKSYFLQIKHTSKIIKMIVPKGAKYFMNGTEIVSDTLIFPLKEPKTKQKKK